MNLHIFALFYMQLTGDKMHIFNYDFLQEMLLPASLLSLAENISSLRTMANLRKKDNIQIFQGLERIAKIDSIKASNAI